MPEALEPEEGFVDISEDQDGGLLKKVLVQGVGEDSPPPGSHVQVHYTGTLHEDGSKFDSSRDRPGNFAFDVGVGQVIKGWDQGICSMKKGEKCILRCRSDYGYGDMGSPPAIPGGATLNFEVELFSWKEKARDPCDMSPEERSTYASAMKEQGNEAFKVGDWATAINRYEDAVVYITYDPNNDNMSQGHSHGGIPCSGHGDDDQHGAASANELSVEDKVLAVACLNNSAAARLKLEDIEAAKFDCTKALEYDPTNVKAFFRRAQAESASGSYTRCVEDATKALELDPSNAALEQLRRKALDDQKRAKQKEKQMCSKMFG